uniref:Uncharacterized protein n=1 Tax=Strigamia maritima TaxID=126957 RepID=T1IUI1_STRMM
MKQKDVSRITNYAWTDVSGRSILALIISNGYILLYYTARDRAKPVLRQIAWCENYSNRITALCFDPTGSWLVCAAKDAALFIIPALSLLDATVKVDHLWALDDVTKIEMLGKRDISSSRTSASEERAAPTCIVWWQTMDNKSVAIIGNELGEICFINLITHQEVGGTYITTGILNLHLISDDTHDTVYLLITGANNLQWQLLLEKITVGYQWPLESETSRMKEKGNTQVDHRPYRLNRFAGHTQLKPQSAKGRHFVAGYYAPNSILSVHSVDLNIAPLFVYKLPAGANNILLTDRLLFVTTKNQLMILSSQFAESTIDGKKEADPNAQIQNFHLQGEEHVLAVLTTSGAKLNNPKTIASKPGPRSVPSSPRFSARIRRPSGSLGPALGKRFNILDYRKENRLDDIKIPTTRLHGCLVILETMVFECRPRMSPERLFLELVLMQDLKSSEKLGVTLGLDVNKLYETTADYQLSQGHFAAAVRLYQLSKCPHVRSVANFAAHGCVGELLSYVRVLFSNQGVEFPLSDRRHFANMELLCYVHQILELRAGSSTLCQAFHTFLHDNRHYSEPLAVQLLADQGLFELLAVVTEQRGLLSIMLEELLPPSPISWLNETTSALLDARSYGMILRSIQNDGYLKCLTLPSIIHIFYPDSTLSITHCKRMSNLMPQLNVDFLLRLAILYDPSRPCLRMYLKRVLKQQHAEEFIQQNEDLAWELLVIETFIMSLLFLNFRRPKMPAFDLTLVGETSKFPNKFPVSPSKRPRLPRRSSPIGCGLAHAAVIRNQSVYTWGKTDHCCLGCGHMTQECSPPICLDLFFSLATKVVSIACGAWHTLALTNIGVKEINIK